MQSNFSVSAALAMHQGGIPREKVPDEVLPVGTSRRLHRVDQESSSAVGKHYFRRSGASWKLKPPPSSPAGWGEMGFAGESVYNDMCSRFPRIFSKKREII